MNKHYDKLRVETKETKIEIENNVLYISYKEFSFDTNVIGNNIANIFKEIYF